MIDERKLRKKIEKIENERGCSLRFENVKFLIEKIQMKYTRGMSREMFVNLVKEQVKALELSYDYCLIAFSYLGSKKKNIQKNKNTEYLQTVFSFENKIFIQTEITK